MQLFYSAFTFYLLQIVFLFSCLINSSSGRRFSDAYYPDSYYSKEQEKFNLALGKLKQDQKWIKDWPDQTVKLGQVSGVALDNSGNILAFHRGPNVWDANTFTSRDVYANIGEPAIPEPTILVFNDSGHLIDSWGQDLFFIPHGITVDNAGNVWLTDVARHQVFKFTAQDRKKPALVLGDKFVPGDDDQHFCKPSAVAVLLNGDFFVADGYCNTRIIKYAPDGTKILQFGTNSGHSPFVFSVPHALTLAEDRGLVCVADRERGRVGCFEASNGTYNCGFSSWLIGPRLFSVAYASVSGGRLYVVNGPSQTGLIPVRGYIIEFTSGRLIQTFGTDKGLENPHDIVTSPDGSKVYVAEINPFKLLKFEDVTLRNVSKKAIHVKPTATVEQSNRASPTSSSEMISSEPSWSLGAGWAGAAGGGGVLAGAALALGAAVALCRARTKGRKSVPRRRWEYGHGEFKLRRLLERRRFTRVHSDDSDEEPAPMLPPQPPANA